MPVVVKILRDGALRPTFVDVVRGPKIDLDYGPRGELFRIKFKGMHLPSISELLDIAYPRQHLISVRGSNWFDRNPKPITEEYHAIQLPSHAETERWTYTVSEDKIALIEALWAKVMCDKVGAPTSVASSIIYYTPEGESEYIWIFTHINCDVKGNKDEVVLSPAMTLHAGDKLRGTTRDLSTGGWTYVSVGVNITEFDE